MAAARSGGARGGRRSRTNARRVCPERRRLFHALIRHMYVRPRGMGIQHGVQSGAGRRSMGSGARPRQCLTGHCRGRSNVRARTRVGTHPYCHHQHRRRHDQDLQHHVSESIRHEFRDRRVREGSDKFCTHDDVVVWCGLEPTKHRADGHVEVTPHRCVALINRPIEPESVRSFAHEEDAARRLR